MVIVFGLVWLCVSANQAVDERLIEALKTGDPAAARSALEQGASANAREMVRVLPSLSGLEKGGGLVPRDTALMLGVKRKGVEFARLLLDRGADADAKGAYGYTPLMVACQHGNEAAVKLLLDRGAKPNERNDNGDTAIVFAVNRNLAASTELLLKKGADVNGGTGWTPLMEAAYNHHNDMVRLLLRHKADPNAVRPSGMTALECARAQGNTEGAELIRKAGGRARPDNERNRQTQKSQEDWARARQKEADDLVKQWGSLAEVTDRDYQVLDAFLADLATVDDQQLMRFDKEHPIQLRRATRDNFNQYTDTQMSNDVGDEKALQITLDMRLSLQRRNARAVSLSGYKPTIPGVILEPQDAPEYRRSEGPTWVHVFLPGYSPAGDLAVVRFGFGPSPHGATGTYLLEKKEGRWRVKWREFSYYVL